MITVYGVPGSPFVRAALISCIEKEVPHRLQALGPGGSKSAEHLARHPFGRIPAIDHDGFGLYETQAILRYVDAIGAGPSLTPADPKAAARMDQMMGVIDWYFFAPNSALTLVFNRRIKPAFGMTPDEAEVEASLPQSRHVVGVLAGFLEKGPYVTGEAVSLADLHAGPQLDLLSETPEGAEMLKGTAILPWLERLRARPSFANTTWDTLAAQAAA
jgi:glutathione S-transferase